MGKYLVYMDCDMYMLEFNANSENEAKEMFIETDRDNIEFLASLGYELMCEKMEG